MAIKLKVRLIVKLSPFPLLRRRVWPRALAVVCRKPPDVALLAYYAFKFPLTRVEMKRINCLDVYGNVVVSEAEKSGLGFFPYDQIRWSNTHLVFM